MVSDKKAFKVFYIDYIRKISPAPWRPCFLTNHDGLNNLDRGLRVASGPRVKLTSCKSALNPPVVCSTDRSKAVVPVLVLLFVALWFILRGDLLYVFPCVILFLCFSVLLV